jgi:putative endonuclease
MLECGDGSYYCGWSNDLNKRVQLHSEGKGARYTRSRLPVSLVYFEEFPSRSEAMRREYALRKMDHDFKKKLAISFDINKPQA